MVVVLLCMASLLAAMAYTSAEVKASYTIKVTDSASSILALNFDSSVAAGECTGVVDTDGKLRITFGKDNCGLQPCSTYKWDGLVTLTNHSNKAIKVTVTDSDSGPRLVITSNDQPVKDLTIAASSTLPLDVAVKVPAGAGAGTDLTGDIIVSAVTE
ncbi:MAG: hypothetical protein PHC81_02270 [Clostridia bacterium]|nr:hypothetical protein [Clostridia bacterium]